MTKDTLIAKAEQVRQFRTYFEEQLKSTKTQREYEAIDWARQTAGAIAQHLAKIQIELSIVSDALGQQL